jgi:UDP-glucuronate 4-epimerase
MRVVVTGACGFIGSHVSEALLARGDVVVGVDNFNTFYDPAIKRSHQRLLEHKGACVVEGDILDAALMDKTIEGADVVVHLAAWAGVRPSIEQPALYQQQNIEGTVKLLDVMRAQRAALGKPPRMVFASSSSVYGGNKKVPFHEDDAVNEPVSPYAATKRAGEILLWTYAHCFGVFSTSLRFFTVYGPRQRPEMAIHKFASLLLAGKPVPQYGDGSTARDYTYIDDIVAGVLAAVDRTTGDPARIYNLGNSSTITLSALIDAIAVAFDVDKKVTLLPEQLGDVPLTNADISRARAELAYRPQTPILDGLRKFASWKRDLNPGPSA